MLYDAIVVGLGAVGSATVYRLAQRGVRVLGIDRYMPPHEFGSSHGETRITREAVGEGDAYVPLVRRSHRLWREIEAAAGVELFTATGGLVVGCAGGAGRHHGVDFLRGTVECAERFGIVHEQLDAQAIRSRFPQLALCGDETGYFEPGAGFLRPERCIAAQLALAQAAGAQLATDERVLAFAAAGNGDAVEVRTTRTTHLARQLVLAAGPWLQQLLDPALGAAFRVHRQVQYWFDVANAFDRYAPGRFPIFIWMFGEGEDEFLYGFPAIDGPDGGLKVASEQYGLAADPDSVDRSVDAAEAQGMFAAKVAGRLRGVTSRLVRAKACLYTTTPDRGFVVDRHPDLPRVTIASPCSGHGFKHSASLGEAIAQRIVEGASEIDLEPFAAARFGGRWDPRRDSVLPQV